MNISLSSGFLPARDHRRSVAPASRRAPRVNRGSVVLPLLACGRAAAANARAAGLAEAATGGEHNAAPSSRAGAVAPARVGRLSVGAKMADGLATVVVNVDGIVSPGVPGVRNGEIVAVPSRRTVALAGTAAHPTAVGVQAADSPALPAAASQAGALVDAVIAGILGGAARDAADAAFSTDNLDFAIRKGYATTIGRIPPGIDRITGELESTRCDTQVKSDGTIADARSCLDDKR